MPLYDAQVRKLFLRLKKLAALLTKFTNHHLTVSTLPAQTDRLTQTVGDFFSDWSTVLSWCVSE